MRLQINFMLNGTTTDSKGLFSDMQGDYIIPFVFVKRDSLMSEDQVSDILGDLITAGKVKIPILCVLAIAGALLTVCGACCCRKVRSLKNGQRKYSALERQNLIDEHNYVGGLKVQKDTFISEDSKQGK